MRISHHGNDLLITDQSLGLGAGLLAVAVLHLTLAVSRVADGELLTIVTGGYVITGILFVWMGLGRLVATQLIVDPDDRLVIAKRWSFRGTDVQRMPFDAIKAFAVVPEGAKSKTHLIAQTTRGEVQLSHGRGGVPDAWYDIIDAVETHMGRRNAEPR